MSKKLDTTEQDILDLIEGRLPSDRVEPMRAALRADPLLARRVQAMVADRARIQQMSRDDQSAAPTGMVADAVSRAERETLLAPGAHGSTTSSAARWRASRIAAMVALTLVLGGAIAGSALFLSQRGSGAGADARQASGGSAPLTRAPGGVFEVPANEPDPRRASAPLPDLLATRDIGAGTGATRSAPPAPARSAASAPEPAAPGFASSQEQVAQWNREVSERIASEADQALRTDGALDDSGARAPEAMVGGMRLSDAAKLAMEGRLRITTRPRASALALRRIQAGTTIDTGAGRIVEQDSPMSFTVELTARYDPDLSALQDAIAALAQRLSRESFGAATEVQLSEAPQGESKAGPAVPSFRVDDVLWWARPVSTWERAISVRTPVKVDPIPE